MCLYNLYVASPGMSEDCRSSAHPSSPSTSEINPPTAPHETPDPHFTPSVDAVTSNPGPTPPVVCVSGGIHTHSQQCTSLYFVLFNVYTTCTYSLHLNLQADVSYPKSLIGSVLNIILTFPQIRTGKSNLFVFEEMSERRLAFVHLVSS